MESRLRIASMATASLTVLCAWALAALMSLRWETSGLALVTGRSALPSTTMASAGLEKNIGVPRSTGAPISRACSAKLRPTQ